MDKLAAPKSSVYFASFFKAGTLSIAATCIKLCLGLLINKVSAETLDAKGYTLLYQYINFFTIISLCSSGAIETGVVRLIAQNENNHSSLAAIKKIAVKIVAICGTITAALLICFSNIIGTFVFKNTGYSGFISLLGFTVLLLGYYKLVLAIINGYKNYPLYYKLDITQNIIMLALFVALIHFFGFKGAISSYILGAVIPLFIILFLQFKFKNVQQMLPSLSVLREASPAGRAGANKSILVTLLSFSVYSFLAAAIGPYIEIKIRGMLITDYSFNYASLFDAQNRFIGIFIVFTSSLINTYFLPQFASAKKGKDLRMHLMRSIIYIILPFIFCAIVVYFFRATAVKLLFSANFSALNDLIGIQLIGCLISVTNLLIIAAIVAKISNPIYLLPYSIVFSILYYFSLKINVQYSGLKGLPLAYLYTNLLGLVTVGVIFYVINLGKDGKKVGEVH